MTAELRVAVVGAGPAGMYVADALVYQEGLPVRVDVFDRLPTPFGLLRYGVAPDHLKMKSLARTLQRTLDDERVRFFGNVTVGRDIMVDELRASYHAVAYSFGASSDRRLDIRGEQLPGSYSATEFVRWYSGHPDEAAERFDLSGVTSAVVVGVGNVAVDVSRVLCKRLEELNRTDIPVAVLDRIAASTVTDVHVLGRRGPLHAKFTPKELRELGELEGVDVLVDPAELELEPSQSHALQVEPALMRNLEFLQQMAERGSTGQQRRLHLHFWSRPTEVIGRDGRMVGVRVEPTELREGKVVAAGAAYEIPSQLLLRSVGYQGVALPGVPLHPGTGTVPHEGGRVHRDGQLSAGEYVAGWIGRGPVGVLGTNRSDAEGVVDLVLADAPQLLARSVAEDLDALLASRGIQVVDCAGWEAIDAAEIALGRDLGRPRSKIPTWDGLLRSAQGESVPVPEHQRV